MMPNNVRPCVAAPVYMLILLASTGIVVSQDHSQLVDSGVIFSAEHVERSGADRVLGLTPPYWTPSPEQIALLESQLKPYLGRVTQPKAKVIAARLGSYSRQYFGYSDGGKRWIFVNGFCEGPWKKEDTWRDKVVLVIDGGSCFFKVRYDPSRSQFEQLQINGEA
jgi:hypothetical protein